MKHIKKIKIDIDKKNLETISSVQYDSNTRFLHINLVNNSLPLDLTGCSVKISAIKPDDTVIFNNCTIIDAKQGFVEVELTEQFNAVAGNVKCEVKIYSKNGVLTTKQFNIEVTASVTFKEITSTDDFKALTEALAIVDEYAKELQDASTKIEEKYTTRLNSFDEQIKSYSRNFLFCGGRIGAQFDNTTALQKLVDFLAENGGGEIYIPAGIYYFDSSVYWKSNVRLRGQGMGLTILKSRGGSSKNKVEGYSIIKSIEIQSGNINNVEALYNCGFRDLTFDGSELYQLPSYKGKGIFIQKLYNSEFRNLEFNNLPSTALGIDMLHHVVIENVICNNCGHSFTKDFNPQGCAGIGIGTGGLPLENLVISNCQTYKCGQFGIFIEDQVLFGNGGGNPKGVLINNCICSHGVNHGIGIKGGQNTTISNCQSYENEGYGLAFEYNARKVNINDCIFTENEMGGIGLQNARYYFDIAINDCIIMNNNRNGIEVFFENKKDNNTARALDGLVIKGNTIKSNKGDGIKFNNTSNAPKNTKNIEITDNFIYNNNGHGIFSTAMFYNTFIKNNNVFENGKNADDIYSGIYLEHELSNVFIEDNICFDNGYGIALLSRGGVQKKLENSVIRNNNLTNETNKSLIIDYNVINTCIDDNLVNNELLGKISIGNGKYLTIPREVFSMSYDNNVTIKIKIKFKELDNSMKYLLSCYNQNSNDLRGWYVAINTENKIKIGGHKEGNNEKAITFDYILKKNTTYVITINRSNEKVECSINDEGQEIELNGKLSSNSTFDLINECFKYKDTAYVGIHFNEGSLVSCTEAVLYELKTYIRSNLSTNYVFNNLGANKSIKDTRNNYQAEAHGGATQFLMEYTR